MKLDIPYYIRQVLREQRKVHVPGIGTFSLVQSSAIFNNDNTDLSPPELNVSFEDSESNDESLLKYILDTGQLSEAKARKRIEQYTESAFNKLLNVDSFLIEGVGLIFKRENKEKVEFESNVSQLTSEFDDLKVLHLTPISRIAEMNSLVKSEEVNPKIEETTWFWPRIILLALLIIAFWFLGKHFYDNHYNQPDKENSELIDPEVIDVEDKSTLAESSEQELEQRYEEIDELINPSNDDDDDDDAGKNTAKLENKFNEIEEKEKTNPKKVITKEDASPKSELSIEIPVDVADSKGIDEIDKEDSTPQNKFATIIPKSGECIIIVGSFMKSLNAIKMISLLERKGYTVYQSEYKGYSRIGLKYECIDKDLEEYLHAIRKNISKKAWYLDPELVVPYKK